jgi:hypothetical protein
MPSAIKREHPALQHTKFLNFSVIFALLDPDPDSEFGYGSNDLIESGSYPDSDPGDETLPDMQDFKMLRLLHF